MRSPTNIAKSKQYCTPFHLSDRELLCHISKSALLTLHTVESVGAHVKQLGGRAAAGASRLALRLPSVALGGSSQGERALAVPH